MIPLSPSTLTSGAGTPRSAKVLSILTFDFFQASGVPDRRGGSRANQHKVARLPVGKIDRREKAWNLMSEHSTTCRRVWTPTLLVSLPDEQGFPVIDTAV